MPTILQHGFAAKTNIHRPGPDGTWWPHHSVSWGEDLSHLPIDPATDRFADDEEYLDNTQCSGCGTHRDGALRCEDCGTLGCACIVEVASFDCGAPEDGMTLCWPCTPNHAGCRSCDPVMPWD